MELAGCERDLFSVCDAVNSTTGFFFVTLPAVPLIHFIFSNASIVFPKVHNFSEPANFARMLSCYYYLEILSVL